VTEALAIAAPVESLTLPEILPPTPAQVTSETQRVNAKSQKETTVLDRLIRRERIVAAKDCVGLFILRNTIVPSAKAIYPIEQ
jgi:hypothetical protein